MSFRGWLSLITVVLLAVVLFLAREDLMKAWHLLAQVNLAILALMIPVQIIAYYAGGEMVFSYLRGKGHIKRARWYELIRIALEGNFVNHLLPSGGVSGMSYLSWRLGIYGVPPGKATMAQVVRHVAGFVAFAVLLLVALFAVTLDGTINRWMILASCGLFGLVTSAVLLFIYLLSSQRRVERFGVWIHDVLNTITRNVTFGRKRKLLRLDTIEAFLDDMHKDFLELRHDKKLLVAPFVWGIVYTLCDAGLFVIAFLALGETINPAPILIAYGVASLAGFVVLTPGGTGVYEALMVTFLAFAGIAGDVAIAGVLLARVIILMGTIIFGYVFYQLALMKHGGKHDAPAQR